MTTKVIGGAMLLAALALPVPALADPVSFVCTSAELTWTLQIDATARTAATMQAVFTSENVKWHNMLNGSDYNFDLASGALQIDGTAEFTCHADRKLVVTNASK